MSLCGSWRKVSAPTVFCRRCWYDLAPKTVLRLSRVRDGSAPRADTVPVRIVELNGAQALEAQLIENLQRLDVHPMEEAQGFRALINLETPQYTIEQIAAKMGKSPVYVTTRLNLADLTSTVVDAFYAEEIGVGHALLLAKLQPDQQEQALSACYKEVYNGGQNPTRVLLPVRNLQFWIDTNIVLASKKLRSIRRIRSLCQRREAVSIARSGRDTTNCCSRISAASSIAVSYVPIPLAIKLRSMHTLPRPSPSHPSSCKSVRSMGNRRKAALPCRATSTPKSGLRSPRPKQRPRDRSSRPANTLPKPSYPKASTRANCVRYTYRNGYLQRQPSAGARALRIASSTCTLAEVAPSIDHLLGRTTTYSQLQA
jgi:hypothetical protein